MFLSVGDFNLFIETVESVKSSSDYQAWRFFVGEDGFIWKVLVQCEHKGLLWKHLFAIRSLVAIL